MWKPASSLIIPLAAAAIVVGARAVVSPDDGGRWLVVARDSNYTISIDTSRISSEYGRAYSVWYRTDHMATRYYKAKAFNRETSLAILSCDRYAFRTIRTTMSMGDSRPVVQQVNDAREVDRQTWHRVEPGSTEADAARATCVVADYVTTHH